MLNAFVYFLIFESEDTEENDTFETAPDPRPLSSIKSKSETLLEMTGIDHTNVRMSSSKEFGRTSSMFTKVEPEETKQENAASTKEEEKGEEELTEKEKHIIELYGPMQKRAESTNIYNYQEKSLGCMQGNNKVRTFIFKIADSAIFDNFVLFLIFLSSVLLAYDGK